MLHEHAYAIWISNKLKPRREDCCWAIQNAVKLFLYKRHGKLCFYFLKLFLKHVKELETFTFSSIKAHIFRYKKDIVSLLHVTVLGFVTYSSLRIFKSNGIFSLTLKTPLNIAGNSHQGTYKFQWLNFGFFLMNSKGNI